LSLVSKSSLALLSLLSLAAASCDGTSTNTSFVSAVRVNPCEPAALLLDADATAEQEAGARAAVGLWNREARARLTVSRASPSQPVDAATNVAAEGGSDGSHDGAAASPSAPPALPVHFRQAAAPSHGYFDPATGQVLINLSLRSHELAVVLAHEVGHAFGLVHVSGRPSVMASGNLDVEPNAGDVAELVKLWGACAPAADVHPAP
jgi:hypothetical protein